MRQAPAASTLAAAPPATSFGEVASAAVGQAAASAVAVDSDQHAVDCHRAPSSVETVISKLITTEDVGVVKQADKNSGGRGGSIVGRLEPGFLSRLDENTVDCRELQAEAPGGASAVAAATANTAANVGATPPPARPEVVEEAGCIGKGGDGENATPPELVERSRASGSTSGADKAQQHQQGEEHAFPQHLDEVGDVSSADSGLGSVNQSRSLDPDHEQRPRSSGNGPDSLETGSEAMVQSMKTGDGERIQEPADDGRGLEAQQGAANDGRGSGLAEASAGKEGSNDQNHREGDSESEEEKEEDEDDSNNGEEGREGDEDEPAKTDEETRCDLKGAIDSLQFLLVRRLLSANAKTSSLRAAEVKSIRYLEIRPRASAPGVSAVNRFW